MKLAADSRDGAMLQIPKRILSDSSSKMEIVSRIVQTTVTFHKFT